MLFTCLGWWAEWERFVAQHHDTVEGASRVIVGCSAQLLRVSLRFGRHTQKRYESHVAPLMHTAHFPQHAMGVRMWESFSSLARGACAEIVPWIVC